MTMSTETLMKNGPVDICPQPDRNKSKAVLPPIASREATDHLPQNLLITLTESGKKFEDLGPNKSRKNKYTKRAVDNVWNHEKSRSKFKHLTEQPPCSCGAGRY